MINLSPNFILVPFFVYLFLHLALGLLNIKHLFKTGAVTFTSFVFTSIFIVYTLIILGATYDLVGNFNWSEPIKIDLANIINSSNQF